MKNKMQSNLLNGELTISNMITAIMIEYQRVRDTLTCQMPSTALEDLFTMQSATGVKTKSRNGLLKLPIHGEPL